MEECIPLPDLLADEGDALYAVRSPEEDQEDNMAPPSCAMMASFLLEDDSSDEERDENDEGASWACSHGAGHERETRRSWRRQFVRDFGLIVADEGAPSGSRLVSSGQRRMMLSAVSIILVTVAAAVCAGLLLRGKAAEWTASKPTGSVVAFAEQPVQIQMGWTRYEQFDYPGLKTVNELHYVEDEQTAEDYADQHGYNIFTLNVKSQTATFKADLGREWDVVKRGPLTKYDLQYLGYWSPHVLYIKRPQFDKCGFSGVVCGLGFPTENIIYCPEGECTMNPCCTDVAPITTATTTTTDAVMKAIATTVTTVNTTTTLPTTTSTSTQAQAQSATTLISRSIVPTTSAQPRRRRSQNNNNVNAGLDDAALALEGEDSDTPATNFDDFSLSVEIMTTGSDDQLDMMQGNVGTAVTNVVKGKTVNPEEVQGWENPRTRYTCQPPETSGQRPCRFTVVIALQPLESSNRGAIGRVRQAVQNVQGMPSTDLLNLLNQELNSGRRLVATSAASSGPQALAPTRNGAASNAVATLRQMAAGGGCLICDVKKVETTGSPNAGGVAQYDGCFEIAIVLVSAMALMVLMIFCCADCTPYKAKAYFTILVQNVGPEEPLKEELCEPLCRAVAKIAGNGVEMDDVRIRVDESRCNDGKDPSKAARDRSRADLVVEVKHGEKPEKLGVYSTWKVTIDPGAAAQAHKAQAALQAQPMALSERVARGVEVATGCASIMKTTFTGSTVAAGNYFQVDVRSSIVITALVCSFHASVSQKLYVWMRPGPLGDSPGEGPIRPNTNKQPLSPGSEAGTPSLKGSVVTPGSRMRRGEMIMQRIREEGSIWNMVAVALVEGTGQREVDVEIALEPGEWTLFVAASGGGLEYSRAVKVGAVFTQDDTVSIYSGYSSEDAQPGGASYVGEPSIWNGCIQFSHVAQERRQVLREESGVLQAGIDASSVARAWYGQSGHEWHRWHGYFVMETVRNALANGDPVRTSATLFV